MKKGLGIRCRVKAWRVRVGFLALKLFESGIDNFTGHRPWPEPSDVAARLRVWATEDCEWHAGS